MLDAVLLDWEGVLTDTGSVRRDALLRALSDEGVPFSVSAYDDCCGGLDVRAAAAEAVARASRPDPTLADLVTLRASRRFAEHLAAGFVLTPGAAAFVAEAEPRTRLAIATRATRAETELALRLSGLAQSFAFVVTRDDVLEAPPAPALYSLAMKFLSRHRHVRYDHVVALTSAAAAVRSARAAGLRPVAVHAPAHVAIEADAALDGLAGNTLDGIAALLGLTPAAKGP